MNMQHSAISFKQTVQHTIETIKIIGDFGAFSHKALDPIRKDLPLSSEIVEWYRIAAPVDLGIPWTVERLMLYNPMKLVVYQEGYRWEVGKRGDVDSHWDKNWIVIGDISSDPVIAHINEVNTPISFALHGIGSWSPLRVAPDLATFLDAISTWLQVFTQYHGDIIGLDDALRPDFIVDLENELKKTLSPEYVKNFREFCD